MSPTIHCFCYKNRHQSILFVGDHFSGWNLQSCNPTEFPYKHKVITNLMILALQWFRIWSCPLHTSNCEHRKHWPVKYIVHSQRSPSSYASSSVFKPHYRYRFIPFHKTPLLHDTHFKRIFGKFGGQKRLNEGSHWSQGQYSPHDDKGSID